MKYSEKLKDPRWQKKRLEIFKRDGWFCKRCGDNENTLAVHHLRYLPKTEPWDYPNNLLITLCQECHSDEYNNRPEAEQELLNTLREKPYFQGDLWNLSLTFTEMDMPYPAEVIVDILHWILVSGQGVGMKELSEKYFAYLKEKNYKKKE